ncbi:hypothetical protein NLX83_16720 [Allokutzneria sp. A3M-2-11 16]|uniref:hypothetical protein n=1 Tax=Allokutzneria sp. A3M-2-11 16 TaxID=2962043 RepID=UPI0020B751FF|nr:hypothetical protein [Allokutzneria sp. A3M-2-11 16]MCP3800910.1 hypothetical protein [Allokutzneria sp. A3M-2-11 16]
MVRLREFGTATWVVSAAVAFGVTVVGVLALYFAQSTIIINAFDGQPPCGPPDCGLGIGVWLIVSAFVMPFVALVAGVIHARRRRAQLVVGSAVRSGLVIAAWCLLGYVGLSVIAWGPAWWPS